MKFIFFIAILLQFIGSNIIAQSLNNNITISGYNLSPTTLNNQNNSSNSLSCDTTFSFPIVNDASGLTWDGHNLWYVSPNYIYKVAANGAYIDSIANPGGLTNSNCGGLTFDGINLWYVNEQSAELFKLDPSNGNILRQFNLPSYGQIDPNGWGLAWDGNYIWHSQYLPEKLFKINPLTGSIINMYPTTTGILGLQWINGKLYGLHHYGGVDMELFLIDSNTGLFLDSADWCIPVPLGFTWDGENFRNLSTGPYPAFGLQRIYTVYPDFISSVSGNLNENKTTDIFPNPFIDETAIVFNREYNNVTIKILDVLGKEIKSFNFSGTRFALIKDDMKAGIYFIHIADQNKIVLNKKIIIQ
jgi:hypothetical protein